MKIKTPVTLEPDRNNNFFWIVKDGDDEKLTHWTTKERAESVRDCLNAHDELLKLLHLARCPNCDGSGAKQINEDTIEQCQWCDERSKALYKYLTP